MTGLSKFALPALGILAIGLPVSFIYVFKRHFYSEDDYSYKEVNEILFFSNEGSTCRAHFIKDKEKKTCSLPNCSFYNLSRMLYYLNNAKQSLDVCLYLITIRELSEAVIKAQRRGVKVRVVTDEDMANGSGSMIATFRQSGLSVRNPRKATTLMHHKFVIIDEEILMTGSLNWTMQAICGNWDNLLITSNPPLVQGFVTGFNRIWDQLK